MKIVLCNPDVNLKYSHSRKGMYPPLGLLSLATYLEKKLEGKIEVSVLDGDVEKIPESAFMDADIVGFHANSFNYSNCLALAEKAKGLGKTVILGGPHATVLWKNIMKNRVFIDFIIMNEGEIPLFLLIENLIGGNRLKFQDIPNLVFREKDSPCGYTISRNTYKNTPLDMTIPFRKYVDLEKYVMNYENVYSDGPIPFKRPSSVYSSKGCLWRDQTGGCIFCARLEKGVVFRNISDLWQEISGLRDRYAIDSIWDISDDNLNDGEWFKEYARNKPAGLKDFGFFIYTRVNRITDDIVPYLKMLNVNEVYLGFESGDQEILKRMVKGISLQTALAAAKRLKKAGIYYFPSFVIGLPGESVASLENTLLFAKELSEIGSIYRMSATILWPAPGSPAFNRILNDPEHGEALSGQDDISIKELEKLWISKFTGIDYDTALEYQKKISNCLLESAGAKSFGKGEA